MASESGSVVSADRSFRDAMGMFASGVTVITVGRDGDVHGMTANAVMSVSLRPPLIAVAVDNRAYTNDLIRDVRHFAVNILTEEQAAQANRFARRFARGAELFADVPHTFSERGDPLLDGCIGQFGCAVVNEHVEGDHTLWIGQAESFAHSSAQGNPLVFYRGSFSSTSCQFCVVRHDPMVALMAMHES